MDGSLDPTRRSFLQLGGLGSLAPERRDEVAGLGMKALVAGTLATCMTGAVIGIFT